MTFKMKVKVVEYVMVGLILSFLPTFVWTLNKNNNAESRAKRQLSGVQYNWGLLV